MPQTDQCIWVECGGSKNVTCEMVSLEYASFISKNYFNQINDCLQWVAVSWFTDSCLPGKWNQYYFSTTKLDHFLSQGIISLFSLKGTYVLHHMCILAHKHMGRPICVYSYGTPIRVWNNILPHITEYFICMFYFFTGLWIYCCYK